MKLFHQKLIRVDRPVNALTCIQKEEKLSKFSYVSFCQKIFFRNKISSCKCPMGVQREGTI